MWRCGIDVHDSRRHDASIPWIEAVTPISEVPRDQLFVVRVIGDAQSATVDEKIDVGG
jgi:hypothetical protein